MSKASYIHAGSTLDNLPVVELSGTNQTLDVPAGNHSVAVDVAELTTISTVDSNAGAPSVLRIVNEGAETVTFNENGNLDLSASTRQVTTNGVIMLERRDPDVDTWYEREFRDV